MKGHMTLATQGHAVRNLVAELGIVRIRLHVVRRKAAFALLTFATALLANVIIALQHSFAPREVLGILEALPRAPTFPIIVILAPW